MDANSEIGSGSGSFRFQDGPDATGKSLAAWFHCPTCFTSATPIVILLHGSDRAAAFFRDCWSPYADRYGFLIVAPEFDAETFPGPETYNYGNVRQSMASDSLFNPQHSWSYSIIDRLFETIRSMTGSERSSFCLFGHSAGAQFAHRYLALTPEPIVEFTVAANAGWYMTTDINQPFPAGLGGLSTSEAIAKRFFERRLVLLLGDADTDATEAGLPQYPGAVAQGPDRLARGRFYYEASRHRAATLRADFRWRLSIAPGVGHADDQVAGPAAKIIADYVREQTAANTEL